MGIRLDRKAAWERLCEAIALAKSAEPLPDEWTRHARQVAASPNKTFLVALATGLLARATDQRVNALILKETYNDPGAYSARSLAHEVLVPLARDHGIDLLVTGREPLNNQPFFRYERVDEMGRVRKRARESHRYLVECLKAANGLGPDEALRALAALLRTRMQRHVTMPDLTGVTEPLATLGVAVTRFLAEAAEEGKRAQAVVAAILDLAFQDVRTSRVNDPSRRWPGDCHVMAGDNVVMAAEVRAKPVLPGEVTEFARKLGEAGIRRGLVVAISPRQEPLNPAGLAEEARVRYGVLLQVRTDISGLLADALMWSPRPIQEALARFPTFVLKRLVEMEVQQETLTRWAALYDTQPSSDRT